MEKFNKLGGEKMIKKIFVFISLFFMTAIPAFADCTISVSPNTFSSGVSTPVTVTVNETGAVQSNYLFDDTAPALVGFTSAPSWCSSGYTMNNNGYDGTSNSNVYCGTVTSTGNTYTWSGNINITADTTIAAAMGFSNDPTGNPRDICSTNISISGGVLGGAITLDPTVQGNLNAGLGSLGTNVIGEVVSLLPIILPVIAVIFIIGFGIKFFKRHSR
jgi:hypothetical protein